MPTRRHVCLATLSIALVSAPLTCVAAGGAEYAAVALADLEAIRSALLERIRSSSLADRDELLALTQSARTAIDNGGAKRIGQWQFFATHSGLVLSLRIASAEDLIVLYRTSVHKDGKVWRVGELDAQFIHRAP